MRDHELETGLVYLRRCQINGVVAPHSQLAGRIRRTGKGVRVEIPRADFLGKDAVRQGGGGINCKVEVSKAAAAVLANADRAFGLDQGLVGSGRPTPKENAMPRRIGDGAPIDVERIHPNICRAEVVRAVRKLGGAGQRANLHAREVVRPRPVEADMPATAGFNAELANANVSVLSIIRLALPRRAGIPRRCAKDQRVFDRRSAANPKEPVAVVRADTGLVEIGSDRVIAHRGEDVVADIHVASGEGARGVEVAEHRALVETVLEHALNGRVDADAIALAAEPSALEATRPVEAGEVGGRAPRRGIERKVFVRHDARPVCRFIRNRQVNARGDREVRRAHVADIRRGNHAARQD